MSTFFSANFQEHSPGAPMPIAPERAVWVLTVGNSTPFCIRAGDLDWTNTDDRMRDIVLAWAPVVKNKETDND